MLIISIIKQKEEIALIEAKEELLNYWEQSNISALYIARLKKLIQFPNEDIQKLAHLILAVAAVKPHKRRRMKWLKQNKRDLYLRVRDYFGEEFFVEYEFDDIDIDDCTVFSQELTLDIVSPSTLDEEPLPF